MSAEKPDEMDQPEVTVDNILIQKLNDVTDGPFRSLLNGSESVPIGAEQQIANIVNEHLRNNPNIRIGGIEGISSTLHNFLRDREIVFNVAQPFVATVISKSYDMDLEARKQSSTETSVVTKLIPDSPCEITQILDVYPIW
ncbi:hypothetical protein HOF56_03845 [Candidatus Peribacteria bacterium]|nr:hypothetical protein [Candidatus Peribacteria bacterium]